MIDEGEEDNNGEIQRYFVYDYMLNGNFDDYFFYFFVNKSGKIR